MGIWFSWLLFVGTAGVVRRVVGRLDGVGRSVASRTRAVDVSAGEEQT